MPRKKIPDNVKQLRGTFTPSRALGEHVEFDTPDAPPEAPQYLDVHAKAYWDRIAPILLARNVLTEADYEALEVMAALYGRVKRATVAGVDVANSAITQLRLYQAEFGLTPASRPRIKPESGALSDNPFDKNGRKR